MVGHWDIGERGGLRMIWIGNCKVRRDGEREVADSPVRFAEKLD